MRPSYTKTYSKNSKNYCLHLMISFWGGNVNSNIQKIQRCTILWNWITIKLKPVGVKCQAKLTRYNIPICWAPPAWIDDSKLSVRSCRPIISSSLRFSSRESSCVLSSPLKICRNSRWLSDSNQSSYSGSLSFLTASGCSLWYLQNTCEYKFTTHYQLSTLSFSL